ncbi:MAG: peptidoglycan-binding domain-containing protein [Rhodospirillales bacterium]
MLRPIFRVLLPASIWVAAITLHAPAQAADTKGNFALRGIGSQSCQALLDELQKAPGNAVVAASWVLGYMSATNRYEPDTFDISPVTDAQSIFNVVIGLCKAHPTVRVQTILSDTLAALGKARIKTDSPMVDTKSGTTVASVRTETLVLVQKKLAERGLLKAKADGAYGAQTEAAVKDFQKAEKLPITGVVDSATVIRLLIEQPPATKK